MEKESSKRRLIVNADDLGWSEHRDRGIFELFEKGRISSATVLMNGYNAENAIKAARNIGVPLGVHLNLTEGPPVNRILLENNSLATLGKWRKSEEEAEGDEYVMHGKTGFRERVRKNEINGNDIANEVYSQIFLFIKLYGSFPTHVDCHQHVHIIPFVASVIAEVLANMWGIYKIRIPEEFIEFDGDRQFFTDFQRKFYNEIVEQSKTARSIYAKHGIYSTDHYFGINFMGKAFDVTRLRNYLRFLDDSKFLPKNYSIELMCHPGYKSKNFGDDFNKSGDREHEKCVLESDAFLELLNEFKIISYESLRRSETPLPSKGIRLLIFSDLTPSTGNYTTSLRYKTIFSEFCEQIFFRNNKLSDQAELSQEINSLKNFIEQEGVNLIFGVHAWRSGRLIYNLFKNYPHLQYIPYVIILAGTDVNVFLNDNKCSEIKDILKGAFKVISLNEVMKNRVEEKIREGLGPITVIPQSVNEEAFEPLIDYRAKYVIAKF